MKPASRDCCSDIIFFENLPNLGNIMARAFHPFLWRNFASVLCRPITIAMIIFDVLKIWYCFSHRVFFPTVFPRRQKYFGNYASMSGSDHPGTLRNVTAAMLALSWIAVMFRVYVRAWMIKAFGADDCFSVATLVSGAHVHSLNFVLISGHTGHLHTSLLLYLCRSRVPNRHQRNSWAGSHWLSIRS